MYAVEYKREDIKSGKLRLSAYATREAAEAAAAFLEQHDDMAHSVKVVEIKDQPAPELLAELLAALRATQGELIAALGSAGMPLDQARIYPAVEQARAAIARATGKA